MKHQIKSNNFNAKKSLNLLNSNKILNSSVTTILNLNSKPNPKSLLNNIPYSLKDMISTKDIQTTGGSKILENYVPTFNATIYDKLIDGGAILISKTNCDELGMGGTGLTSGYGKVVNPFDKNRIVGGSSSGSAVQVALDIVPFSVGTDTADSIRTPASYMGLVGFKPSYGIISRYGVIPYAPSLDTVGVLAKTIADIAIVLQTISGYDEKDGTSQKINNKFYDCLKPKSKIKFTLIKDIDQYLNKEVKDIYLDYVKKISEKYEIIYKTIDLRLWESISAIYMIISYTEACSCHSNFTSIPFGKYNGGHEFNEIATNARKLLGDKVKEKNVIGAYFLNEENYEKMYLKAKKVRTVLKDLWNKLMDDCDCLLIPSHSMFAPLVKDIESNKLSDHKNWLVPDLLQLANFAGTPSLTLPIYKDKALNFGVNLNTKHFKDQELLNIGLELEENKI